MDRTSMGQINNAGIKMKHDPHLGGMGHKITMRYLWDGNSEALSPSRLLFLILTVGVGILASLPLGGILCRVLELWSPAMLIIHGIIAIIFIMIMDNLRELFVEEVAKHNLGYALAGYVYLVVFTYISILSKGANLNTEDYLLGPSINYQYIVIMCIYLVFLMYNLYEQVQYHINRSLYIVIEVATITYAGLNSYLIHQMSSSYRALISELNIYTIAATAMLLVGIWAIIMLRKRK